MAYQYAVERYTLEHKRSGLAIDTWLNDLNGKIIYLNETQTGLWVAVVEKADPPAKKGGRKPDDSKS